MSKYSQVMLLCEDLQQDVFGRTYLTWCGIEPKRIRTILLPRAGAGESFVRRRYPIEVKALRRLSGNMNICLAVMIDADNGSVQDHYVQLDRALQQANLPVRQPDEKIGIFVPKRNIETWIRYLHGNDVDEVTAYPHMRGEESRCKRAVRAFAAVRHQLLPLNTPPSLAAACAELERILP